MEVHAFFLQLMVLLLVARLFAEVAARLSVPSVIGELLAGVVLGPSRLGWLSPGETFKLLAEIGIILLLFEVGLETDMRRLIRAGSGSLIIALKWFCDRFGDGLPAEEPVEYRAFSLVSPWLRQTDCKINPKGVKR